jgi:predicted glycogen debranching enzyme
MIQSMPPPNLDRSEWLEADGLGGFASGTVCGLRTRRYHALLLAATTPPSGRMVLVNGLDAEIESDGKSIPISTQRYLPGVNSPDGLNPPLASFTTEPWPQWTWLLPSGGKIIQELFVPRGQTTVVLRWRAEGPSLPALKLNVRPFFSGRDFHALHHENSSFNFTPQNIPAGQRWHFYPGVPSVLAQSNGLYHHEPTWYRNFLYDEELARGLDYAEDLAAPGRYLFDLHAGPAVLIFSAEIAELQPPSADPSSLASHWSDLEKSRRATFSTPRLRAADAYLVRRGAGKTIIAGYPWFGDWGRDTFISMRGLCLATGRLDEAREILVAWSALVSQGMLPNRFPDFGDQLEYNSVDASLWYIIVVHEFLAAARNRPELLREKAALLAAVDAILAGYAQGTRFGIRADTDGLLACGIPGMQLTWMDAKVDDWVVTPRIGKPVEIQALWLNALALAANHSPQWTALFEKGHAAFAIRFWNESRGCLYDVVDVDHVPGTADALLRPNQLFALGGLPIAFLSGARALRAVQLVQDQLWTPLGLRSLAPGEPGYAPHYVGDRRQRDGAYHQGTVWPWLTGPFLEAFIRVHGETPEAISAARALLEASQLLRPDLPHLPEIADAESPYTPRGCPFQAWSLGEILRLQLRIFQPDDLAHRLNL